MKIASSTIDLSSQHSAVSSHTVKEQLRTWVGSSRPDFEGQGKAAARQPVMVEISAAARGAQAAEASASQAPEGISDSDAMTSLLVSLVEMIIGHKLKLSAVGTAQGTGSSPQAAGQTGAQAARPAGYGVEYQRHEEVAEAEQTNFQASGTIHTSDGKAIAFNLDVQMARSYQSSSDVSILAGDAKRKDPLVINFAGTSAQLQSTRFAFDLEGNGSKANVALLGQGSAYVALDSNGNGKVDSGKELFGSASGNGFADLAKYDVDGNGWIDDNDPVFSQLKAWSPDAKGGGSLISLKALGVGALYLGAQTTPFELKDANNQSLGAVRATGVYANENGSVGSLQQVDLNV